MEMVSTDRRRILSDLSAVFRVLNEKLLDFTIPCNHMLEDAEIIIASPVMGWRCSESFNC